MWRLNAFQSYTAKIPKYADATLYYAKFHYAMLPIPNMIMYPSPESSTSEAALQSSNRCRPYKICSTKRYPMSLRRLPLSTLTVLSGPMEMLRFDPLSSLPALRLPVFWLLLLSG